MEPKYISARSQTVGFFSPIGFLIGELIVQQHGFIKPDTPILLYCEKSKSTISVTLDSNTQEITIDYVNFNG